MKTERAIELLNRISDSQFDGVHGDERREALEMAVRALEQNLVKESDGLVNDLVKDCIGRQAVAKWLERWDGYVDKDIIERMKLRVIDIPSAQQERKKGKWIYHSNWEVDGECGYECSECGMGSDVDYNYCMRCGARMVKEGEEHD